MEILRDTIWHRTGMTILWDPEALGQITQPKDIVSIRQMVQLSKAWPEDLPANGGNTLFVAGLDACLDLMAPAAAEGWLTRPLREWILSFQENYQSQAGIVFYIPEGDKRIRQESTGTFVWRCGPPNTSAELDFGRALWSGAADDVSWLGAPVAPNAKQDPIGLFLRRLS